VILRTAMVSLFKRALGLGISAALLTAAGPSSAKITWNLQPSGTGAYDWTLRQHWTFNLPNGTNAYSCSSGNCSYHEIAPIVSWGGPGMAAPECLELVTYPGNSWGTPNPDTVIEVSDTSGNWQRISDDYGGTLQSHARIWIAPVTTTMTAFIRVSAYSSSHNSDDFYVGITRRALNQSDCTSGQSTIPWVQITDSPHLTVTVHAF
jgi:hypothetical protein